MFGTLVNFVKSILPSITKLGKGVVRSIGRYVIKSLKRAGGNMLDAARTLEETGLNYDVEKQRSDIADLITEGNKSVGLFQLTGDDMPSSDLMRAGKLRRGANYLIKLKMETFNYNIEDFETKWITFYDDEIRTTGEWIQKYDEIFMQEKYKKEFEIISTSVYDIVYDERYVIP
jgi:hypothetical protein